MKQSCSIDGRLDRGVSRRALFARWKRRWPFLIWLLACACAVYLYVAAPQQDGSIGVRGKVESDAASISAVETAGIKLIHVSEGQTVKKGEVLVEMDTSLIEHGITADIVDATRIEIGFGDTHQDVLQAVSQRLDAIAAMETDIALCRQEWTREQAELDSLRDEQQLRDQIHKQGVIDELTRRELLPQIANLEKAMSEYPTRMKMLSCQLDIAKTYYTNIMKWLGAEKDEAISDAIQRRLNERSVLQTLETAKDQARLYREAYTLRSPRDGIVSAVYFAPGDVVTAGLPIMRISSKMPTHITAYMDEANTTRLLMGARVEVRSASRQQRSCPTAIVEGVSHEIRQVGYDTIAGRQMPFFARTARLRIEGEHGLIGGEAVLLVSLSTHSLAGIMKVLGLGDTL